MQTKFWLHFCLEILAYTIVDKEANTSVAKFMATLSVWYFSTPMCMRWASTLGVW